MYCKNCGQEINDKAVFCIHCGCAVEQAEQPKQETKTNTLAIVGFILSFLIPLAGLICSVLGFKRANRELDGAQKGLAVAGTVISSVLLLAEIICIILAIIFWISFWATLFTPHYYAATALLMI